ncbi:699_t:CDS:2 [Funneliformis caledonium]|uniref:699_t:CDS:1 n=1 Tax=Funneliformis caledonium TaxID=1117310 RepID=A0A9N9NIX8_9GLOM|nr:699_t:CDS:2 [Funneliformis caledonium]
MESSLVLVCEQAEQSQEILYQGLLSFLHRMARLWIHIEKKPRAEKFCIARGNPELDEIDLNDISSQLILLLCVIPYLTLKLLFAAIYSYHCSKKFIYTTVVFVKIKENQRDRDQERVCLNKIVGKITSLEGSDEHAISLSIRISGEVLKKFLHQEGSFIADVRKFKIDLDPSITREEFKLLIDELEKKSCTFKSVVRNESTCREFISAFMTTAIKHVQSIEERLELKAEEWLDRTYDYKPTDYAIYVESIIALVAEVKKEDFEKGAA